MLGKLALAVIAVNLLLGHSISWNAASLTDGVFGGIEMQMVQTKLASGNARMVCWLPRDPRVKVGTIISLDKSEERWRVEEQWMVMERAEINRGWNAGGL